MKYLVVAKYSGNRNNGWKVSAVEVKHQSVTELYYIMKLTDNFKSNMLGTGCYTHGLMSFWWPFEFLKAK